MQPENVPPISAFSYECVELTCTFTSESSDEVGPLVTTVYDFGDGTQDGIANPTHTYRIGGTYTVRLVVQDTDGARVESRRDIQVNSTPTVAITSPIDEMPRFDLGSPITFSATGSDLETAELDYARFHVQSGKSDLLSTQAEFTTGELPLGTLFIEVLVADEDGATASAFVEVVIEQPTVP